MENGKSGSESSILQLRGKFPYKFTFVFPIQRRVGPVCAGLGSRPGQTPPNIKNRAQPTRGRSVAAFALRLGSSGGLGAAETGVYSGDN